MLQSPRIHSTAALSPRSASEYPPGTMHRRPSQRQMLEIAFEGKIDGRPIDDGLEAEIIKTARSSSSHHQHRPTEYEPQYPLSARGSSGGSWQRQSLDYSSSIESPGTLVPSYAMVNPTAQLDEDSAVVAQEYPELFQAGVYEHAQKLGIDPDTEHDLMWIARDSLVAPLPQAWISATASETGEPYYYNTETGESCWDHPWDDQFRQMVHQYRHRRSCHEPVSDMHTASFYEQQHQAAAWQEEYAGSGSSYHAGGDGAVWTAPEEGNAAGSASQEYDEADAQSTLVVSSRRQYVRGSDDAEVTALQAKIDELEAARRELEEHRAKDDTLIATLETHTQQLTLQVEDYEQRMKDVVTAEETAALEATVLELRAVVDACEQQMSQLKETNTQLQQQLQDERQRHGEAQGDRDAWDEEQQRLRDEIYRLQRETDEEKAQCERVASDLQTALASVAASAKDLEATRAVVKRLEGDLLRQERKEQDESSSTLSAAQARADAAAALLSEKEGELAAAQAQVEQLQAQLASAVAQHAISMGTVKGEYDGRLSTREAELVASREELATATDAVRKGEEEKAKLMQQVHAAAMQQADAEEQQRTLKRELRALERDLKALQSASKEREDELTATKRVVASLEQRLQDQDTVVAAARRAGYEQAEQAAAEVIKAAQAEKTRVAELYAQELQTRRKLHNRLMELQGNIRVFCRVRPIQPVELSSEQSAVAIYFRENDPASLDLVVGGELSGDGRLVNGAGQKHAFEFDHVFQPASTQADVFEQTKALVTSALDGFNVCIFAYGQTGSGKTHTMEGVDGDRGLNYRSLEELFSIREQRAATGNFECSMKLSILEVYNETVVDLLDKTPVEQRKNSSLELRMGKSGVYVENLLEMDVATEKDVVDLLKIARKNRTVGAHDVNEHSSRSHLVLSIVIETLHKADGKRRVSKLHLIDLAGSERVGKTSASGIRLKEAQNINRSLSALGDVIAALGASSKHVPYRNSKLTFLLQESLSGSSKVLMFVNVSPVQWNAWETLCSLNFAARCRNVALGLARPGGTNSSSSTPGALSPSTTKDSSSGIPLTPSASAIKPSASGPNRAPAPSPSGKNQRNVYG